VVLEKVCEYLYFHNRYLGMTNVPDMEIPPELSLELALAADFLDCMCFSSLVIEFADMFRLIYVLDHE
jgi:hypothetical protein